ncbi:hypothetical protein B0H13DRAFT_1459892, partial [Mycena leptocephala]
FVSDKHSQFETHLLRLRSVPQIPILLGPTLPRPDRSDAEYERWCRAMLVIFKPWREPSDLRRPDETWKDAFSRTTFSEDLKQIMRNMNVENECQDARNEHSKQRK